MSKQHPLLKSEMVSLWLRYRPKSGSCLLHCNHFTHLHVNRWRWHLLCLILNYITQPSSSFSNRAMQIELSICSMNAANSFQLTTWIAIIAQMDVNISLWSRQIHIMEDNCLPRVITGKNPMCNPTCTSYMYYIWSVMKPQPDQVKLWLPQVGLLFSKTATGDPWLMTS